MQDCPTGSLWALAATSVPAAWQGRPMGGGEHELPELSMWQGVGGHRLPMQPAWLGDCALLTLHSSGGHPADPPPQCMASMVCSPGVAY